jgi:hypothetical protein
VRVLLVAHSRQDAHSLLPVADKLSELDPASQVHFLALDRFYEQGVESELHAAGVRYRQLPNPGLGSLRGEWGALPLLRVVLRLAPEIRRIVAETDAILCANAGVIEGSLFTEARRLGVPRYVIQPGLVFDEAVSAGKRAGRWIRRTSTRLGSSLMSGVGLGSLSGRGGGRPYARVSAVFAMGEDSRVGLQKLGAKADAIVVSGVPRLAAQFSLRSTPVDPQGGVLYLTGAWLWHGESEGEALQQQQLRSLCAAASFLGRLRIRVHPRDDRAAYRWCLDYDHVELSGPEQPLGHDVVGAAVVASRVSTAVVEAVVGGRLGVMIDPPRFRNKAAIWRDPFFVQRDVGGAIGSIREVLENPALAGTVRDRELELVAEVISPDTPQAARVIAGRILGDATQALRARR